MDDMYRTFQGHPVLEVGDPALESVEFHEVVRVEGEATVERLHVAEALKNFGRPIVFVLDEGEPQRLFERMAKHCTRCNGVGFVNEQGVGMVVCTACGINRRKWDLNEKYHEDPPWGAGFPWWKRAWWRVKGWLR